IRVSDRPAIPTMGDTGPRSEARHPTRAVTFLRREWTLASRDSPEEPGIVESEIDVKERRHEGQRDNQSQGVIGMHDCGPFDGCVRRSALLRASQTCTEAAGDGGVRLMRRNADPCGKFEKDGLSIPGRQRLRSDR